MLIRKHPLLMAVFCTLLWGAAGPLIKAGYEIFEIKTTAARLLFAGIRFFLAGVMVLLVCKASRQEYKKPGFFRAAGTLAMVQTILQYIFYYLGMALISGVAGAVFTGSGALITALLAVYVFRYEKMTWNKAAAMGLGLAGLLLMSQSGPQGQWPGLGLILLSQVMAGLSAGLIKKFGARYSPSQLSGWQFMLGGLILSAASLAAGARLERWNAAGILILILLAFISAGAYTIWGMLLKEHELSRIGLCECFIPLFGILFSALLLQEWQQAFSIRTLLAAACICMGIFLIHGIFPIKTITNPKKTESGFH